VGRHLVAERAAQALAGHVNVGWIHPSPIGHMQQGGDLVAGRPGLARRSALRSGLDQSRIGETHTTNRSSSIGANWPLT
jgi:hypothetical protein